MKKEMEIVRMDLGNFGKSKGGCGDVEVDEGFRWRRFWEF